MISRAEIRTKILRQCPIGDAVGDHSYSNPSFFPNHCRGAGRLCVVVVLVSGACADSCVQVYPAMPARMNAALSMVVSHPPQDGNPAAAQLKSTETTTASAVLHGKTGPTWILQERSLDNTLALAHPTARLGQTARSGITFHQIGGAGLCAVTLLNACAYEQKIARCSLCDLIPETPSRNLVSAS